MLDYAKGYNGGDMRNHVPNTQPKTIRHQPNYPRLKLILIRIISCVCIVLGAMSIIVQVAASMIYLALLRRKAHIFEIDNAGFGIWGGALYSTAGSLGLAAAHKRTKSSFVITLVMSIISIAASIIALPLTGIAANLGVMPTYSYINNTYNVREYCSTVGDPAISICNSWQTLEWFLFSFHLLAFASNIILVTLVCLALNCVWICCCTCSEPSNSINAATIQDPIAPQLSYMATANNLANNGLAEKSERLKVMYDRDRRDGQDAITFA